MWSYLRAWWHDGETPGAEVYRQSWFGTVAGFGLTLAGLLFLPALRDPILAPLYCLCWVRAFAEARRALIFADGRVLLRSAYARARPVALRGAVSMQPCSVIVPVLLTPSFRRGVLVSTSSGSSVRLPVDFPRSAEIEQRLRAAFAVGDPPPGEIQARG
ncbi:MAG: hypothetical protein ACRD1E_00735 [Terriglobales bacterium]